MVKKTVKKVVKKAGMKKSVKKVVKKTSSKTAAKRVGGKSKGLFHLSHTKNKKSILKNGLKSQSGEIFLFTNMSFAKNIAFGQVGLTKYSIFSIDKAGIQGKLHEDNVAEFGAEHQKIAKQKSIEARYITHLSDQVHNKFDLAEEINRELARKLGSDETTLVEFMVRMNPKWLVHYQKKYKKNMGPLVGEVVKMIP